MEKWKKIQGYNDYEVSDYGRVKSFKFNKEKILSLVSTTSTGYYFVKLTKNKIEKTIAVHRLVAKAFIDNPHNKNEVNHINGNKLDNNVNNLEWVTRQENIEHATVNGLFKTEKQIEASIKNLKKASEINKKSVKITKNNETYTFNSMKEANQFIGCSKMGVNAVIKNKAKTVYGWSVTLI